MLSKLKPIVPLMLVVFFGPIVIELVNLMVGYKAEASSFARIIHTAAYIGFGASILLGLQYASRRLPRLRKLFGYN